jgi:parallel beta-helix repeat protein
MKKLVFVLVVLAGLGVAVPQALAKTITVDKDKVQCPRAAFQSIQAAVNAAIPGDTVKVCPDLYTENVTVNKPALTLVGASSADGCSVLTAADPTKDSIVTGGLSFAFSLVNNNIQLSGFVVQNSNLAIQTSAGFSGYRITDSIAQNNTAGVNFNSSGNSQSRVDHNCFRSNSAGLQSEIGDLRNALVDHNTTYRNTFAGLDFSGAGARAYVTVTSNSSIEDGAAGVTMDNSIGTSVDHNNAQGTPRLAANYGAISIGGGNNGLAVSSNVINGGVGNGINFNQNNFVPVFPAPSVGTNVIGNQISGTGASGILVIGTATMGSVNLSLFSGNTVSLSGIDGIRIQLSNMNNRIENNETDKNNRNGIYAEGATNNTFANNRAFLNVGFDARDDNRPANTWTGNHCDTDSPPGTICGVG